MEEYRRQKRRYFLVTIANAVVGLGDDRAIQHIREGFSRRVLMVEDSIRFIHRCVREANGRPLGSAIVPELAVHVNAFWLNLCGALDNLAWALKYELRLLPEVSEDGRDRTAVSIFGKKFNKILLDKAPTLAAELEPHKAWYFDLRELRDPAAHRIPIYPIPGVANPEQGREMKRLYAKGEKLIESGDLEGGMALLRTGYNVGTYVPLIALSHQGRVELRDLRTEVERDDETFISVSEIVLNFFRTGSTTRVEV